VRNLYKVLGVASSADDQRIKTVFRRRAKKAHPDLNPGNQRAEARFKELAGAYEVLSNPRLRASYDAYLAECRSMARRRLAQCTGLMISSFALTTTSAVAVLYAAGVDIPVRDSWQIAIAALSSPAEAEAAGSAEKGAGITRAAKVASWRTRVSNAAETSPAPEAAEVATAGKTLPRPGGAGDGRSAAPPSKASIARAHKTEPVVQEPQRIAMAAKRAPASADQAAEPKQAPPRQQSWWDWLTRPAPEPRYGLGGKGL
jgi:hypothetical protein